MKPLPFALVAVAALLSSAAVAVPPGSPDPDFGYRGYLVADFPSRGSRDDIPSRVAVAPDGGIVAIGVVGYCPILACAFPTSNIGVLRATRDGRPDPAFGRDGRAIVPSNWFAGPSANAVAVQADGKIVIAGTYENAATSQSDLHVLRLVADGSRLDPDFGNDGVAIADAGGRDYARAVAIQRDGAIVVAGRSDIEFGNGTTNADMIVARWRADGTPDAGFGDGGVRRIAFEAGRYETANAIALQSDGRIVLAGSVGIGAHADVAIARLTADGDLDATFGNWLPGRSVGGFDALLNDSANAVAIGELRADPAGTRRIVVAGTAQAFDGTTGAALAVFDDAGELDPGFSGDGRRTIGTGTGDGWRAVGVLIETTTVAGHPTPTQSRRIVLGIDASNARDGFRLARFAFDGNLDAGFGIAGIGHWQADLDRDGVPNEASLVDIARHGAGVVLLGTTRVHEPDDALDRDFVLVRATLGQ